MHRPRESLRHSGQNVHHETFAKHGLRDENGIYRNYAISLFDVTISKVFKMLKKPRNLRKRADSDEEPEKSDVIPFLEEDYSSQQVSENQKVQKEKKKKKKKDKEKTEGKTLLSFDHDENDEEGEGKANDRQYLLMYKRNTTLESLRNLIC